MANQEDPRKNGSNVPASVETTAVRRVDSPFGASALPHRQGTAQVDVEQSRAVAEVQSALTIAKRFPRDQREAVNRIMAACQRPKLAERATYTYVRGGADITGPSIRLAEAIAMAWGNLQYGIRELEQRQGASLVEAFAWDVETNLKATKQFEVPHLRHTKEGAKRLTDPRDIYEMVANNGARRLRACILAVIPVDVVESAVEQCEETLKAKEKVTPETIGKMVEAFAEFKVTKEMLQKRCQRNLETISSAQLIGLRRIYNSLNDNMSSIEDWFDPDPRAEEQARAQHGTQTEALKDKLAGKQAAGTEQKPYFDPPVTSQANDAERSGKTGKGAKGNKKEEAGAGNPTSPKQELSTVEEIERVSGPAGFTPAMVLTLVRYFDPGAANLKSTSEEVRKKLLVMMDSEEGRNQLEGIIFNSKSEA